jgi:tetratricopeptide (TPR) repeat protein
LNPKLVEAYYSRGIAYVRLIDNEQVINSFNKVIELNFKDSSAYVTRGNAYINLENTILPYKISARYRD